MDAYSSFASVYDQFMDNVPYEEWAEYLTGLLGAGPKILEHRCPSAIPD